jgi:hypothetical protein
MVVLFYSIKIPTKELAMWANENSGTSVWERAADNEQEQQKIDIQKQNTDLRKQEIQLQQQQQQTNNTMIIGGLAIGGVLVIVVSIYLLSKVFKKKK